jgi:hypothetical protein
MSAVARPKLTSSGVHSARPQVLALCDTLTSEANVDVLAMIDRVTALTEANRPRGELNSERLLREPIFRPLARPARAAGDLERLRLDVGLIRTTLRG